MKNTITSSNITQVIASLDREFDPSSSQIVSSITHM
jgi:hypothetical protein